MSDMTLWFGQNSTSGQWYLASGPTGFTPINIALLPGPKPAVTTVAGSITTQVVGSDWSNASVYFNRVVMNTVAGQTSVDTIRTWGLVKNLQVTSDGGQKLYTSGIVHVDAQVGLNSTEDSFLFFDGVKRSNIITGGGNDIIEIRMLTYDYSVWSDDFRINTGAGNDYVHLAGLDLQAALAAGDNTYADFLATGLPLYTSGENRASYTNLGAGNDRFIGYNSNDVIIGGTDTGTVTQVYANAAPSGYAYSIGGCKVSGLGAVISSIMDIFGVGAGEKYLYKINLTTGETTAVGKIGLKGDFFCPVDVESLALNPVDGMLYGFANSGKQIGLFKIDPNTAATTYIGGNSQSYKSTEQDMTFGADGTLYFASEGQLMKVNTTTGNISKIGNKTLCNVDIEALAIDPTTGKMYGLYDCGVKTSIVQIDIASGKILSTFKVAGVSKAADIEGMSFDSAGHLYAEDRISGTIYEISLATKSATVVSQTLGAANQTGDGFEALAIDGAIHKVLVDLTANGGDKITTDAGKDHIFYAAGDGVDTVTDFDVANDVLHIAGYTASQIKVDVFNGDTFIRFTDNSADGFVDNAMIELDGVTNFNAASIVYQTADQYFATL